MWPVLAMMAAGALTSKMNNDAQADARKSNADMAAAQTRYSPYTGMGAGQFKANPVSSDAGALIGGGMQGAVAGLNLSQSYNKAQAETDMMKGMNGQMSQGQMNQYVKELAPEQSPWLSGMKFKTAYGK